MTYLEHYTGRAGTMSKLRVLQIDRQVKPTWPNLYFCVVRGKRILWATNEKVDSSFLKMRLGPLPLNFLTNLGPS